MCVQRSIRGQDSKAGLDGSMPSSTPRFCQNPIIQTDSNIQIIQIIQTMRVKYCSIGLSDSSMWIPRSTAVQHFLTELSGHKNVLDVPGILRDTTWQALGVASKKKKNYK